MVIVDKDQLCLCNTSYTDSGWTFVSLHDFESDFIAYFEFVEGYSVQFLGVKEEVLLFAFARDESKSSVCKGLDCSVHTIGFIGVT